MTIRESGLHKFVDATPLPGRRARARATFPGFAYPTLAFNLPHRSRHSRIDLPLLLNNIQLLTPEIATPPCHNQMEAHYDQPDPQFNPEP